MNLFVSLFLLGSVDITSRTLGMQTTTPANAVAQTNGISWLTGGGGMVLLLILLSLLLLYVLIERIIVIYRACSPDDLFMGRIKDYVYEHRFDSAKKLCKSTDLPIAKVLDEGVSSLNRTLAEVSNVVKEAGIKQVHRLERGLSFISSIATIAPTMGLLGAVVELMKVSLKVAEGKGDVTLFASGMYGALEIIVIGILVSLFARIAHRAISLGVDKAIARMEENIGEFMELLRSSASHQQQQLRLTQSKTNS